MIGCWFYKSSYEHELSASGLLERPSPSYGLCHCLSSFLKHQAPGKKEQCAHNEIRICYSLLSRGHQTTLCEQIQVQGQMRNICLMNEDAKPSSVQRQFSTFEACKGGSGEFLWFAFESRILLFYFSMSGHQTRTNRQAKGFIREWPRWLSCILSSICDQVEGDTTNSGLFHLSEHLCGNSGHIKPDTILLCPPSNHVQFLTEFMRQT